MGTNFHGDQLLTTGRPNGITDRETYFFELIMHFIADTDTDEYYFEVIFIADADTAVLGSFEGGCI